MFHQQPSIPLRRVFARQRSLNAPGIIRENDSVNDLNKARHLAIKAAHSSDWLLALPISSCGLRMCGETILDLNLCEAHTCPCGALVSARGTHGLPCKRTAWRSSRHHQVNDLIWRALKRCDFRPPKSHRGYIEMIGNAQMALR